MDVVIEVIGLLIAGGGIKYFFDYLLQKKKLRQRMNVDNFKKVFSDIHQVYDCLNNISFNTNAQRVVIVKVENGGGIPTVKSRLRSTILYEVFDHPLSSMKRDWQDVQVGKTYIEYVKGLYEEGSNEFKVSDLERSGFKDVHLMHGTKFVSSHFLVSTSRYFMYVSVQYADEAPLLRAEGRTSIRTNITHLLRILKDDEDQWFSQVRS